MALYYAYPISDYSYSANIVNGTMTGGPTSGTPFILDASNNVVYSGGSYSSSSEFMFPAPSRTNGSGWTHINNGVSIPNDATYLRVKNGYNPFLWETHLGHTFNNPEISGIFAVIVNFRARAFVESGITYDISSTPYKTASGSSFQNYSYTLLPSGTYTIPNSWAPKATITNSQELDLLFGVVRGDSAGFRNESISSYIDISELEIMISGYVYPSVKSTTLYMAGVPDDTATTECLYPNWLNVFVTEYGGRNDTYRLATINATNGISIPSWGTTNVFEISYPTPSGMLIAPTIAEGTDAPNDDTNFRVTYTPSGSSNGFQYVLGFSEDSLHIFPSGNLVFSLRASGLFNDVGPIPVTAYEVVNNLNTPQVIDSVPIATGQLVPSSTTDRYITYNVNMVLNPNRMSDAGMSSWLPVNSGIAVQFGITTGVAGTRNVAISSAQLYMSGVPMPPYPLHSYDAGMGFGPSIPPTLYISGPLASNSGMPLYTFGAVAIASSTPLYIIGDQPLSSSTTLFTQGPLPYASSVPLVTFGPSGWNDNITLYTFANEKHISQQLPINYWGSMCHESGTFTDSGVIKDYFFDFADSGHAFVANGRTNLQWNDINQSGTCTLYYNPSTALESGNSVIWAPGIFTGNIFAGYPFNDVTNRDGTSVFLTSYDYLQTSNILPVSGDYTFYFTYDFSNLTNLGQESGPGGVPSGSIIWFDGIEFYCDGYSQNIIINGTTYQFNGAAPYNPITQRTYDGWNGYIVSYDGKYNVWGISNDYISKLVTTPSMPRVSQSGTQGFRQPVTYNSFGVGPISGITNQNISFTCGGFNVPSGVSPSLYGVNRLGTIASGISNADIAAMNASQAAINPLLNDNAAEPSGFVRYRAYAGNYIYHPSYAGDTPSAFNTGQSYLPSNTIVSGATYSTFRDNIGAFSYVPASSISLPITDNAFASGYMNPHAYILGQYLVPSAGSGRVYGVNNDNVMYSGWIDSHFSGDFLVTLVKEASTYSLQQGSYVGGFYQTLDTKVRYKAAWDTLNIASGYHLYTKFLNNLVELNYDEYAQINYPNSGGQFVAYRSVIQNPSGLTWDGGTLQTMCLDIPRSSGNIYEYDADIHNATIQVNFLGVDTPATGEGITLYVKGQGFTQSGCDLFIQNNPTGAIDLFLKVVDPHDQSGKLNLTVWTVGSSSGYGLGGMPLYTENGAFTSGSIPLFIWSENGAPTSGNTTLYISAPDYQPYNSAMPLTMYNNLASSGTSTYLHTIATSKISGSTTLYMNSENKGLFSGQFPMFIDGGYSPSGRIPLFVSGPTPIHSSTPLFVEGSKFKISGGASLFTRNNYYDVMSERIPLTISNRLDESGGVTFHTLAGWNQNTIPLYLKTLEENGSSGFTPLFIYSASHSGLFQSTSLYIDAVGTSQNIPLYMKTNESAFDTSGITLFTKAGNEFDASVQLYVESVRQSGKSVNFNVIGAGLNPDSKVLQNYIPLYMARPNSNIGNGVSLAVIGPSGTTGSIPLTVGGGTLSHQSVSLSVPVVHAQQSGGTNLFTHGF